MFVIIDYTMLEEMSRATDSAQRRLKTLGGWAPVHKNGTERPPMAIFSGGSVDQPLGTVVKRFRRVVQLVMFPLCSSSLPPFSTLSIFLPCRHRVRILT